MFTLSHPSAVGKSSLRYSDLLAAVIDESLALYAQEIDCGLGVLDARPFSVCGAEVGTALFPSEKGEWAPRCYPDLSGGNNPKLPKVRRGVRRAAGWLTARGPNYGDVFLGRYYGFQGNLVGF